MEFGIEWSCDIRDHSVREIFEMFERRFTRYVLVMAVGLAASVPLAASAQPAPDASQPTPPPPAGAAPPAPAGVPPGSPAPATDAPPPEAVPTTGAPAPSPAVQPPPPGAAAPPPAPGQYAQPYPPTAVDRDYERELRRQRESVLMDYIEGQPVPPGYTVMERPRKGLTITGSILLGVSYGISLAVAAGSEYDDTYGWLAIPVAGPLIASARIDDCDSDGTCEDNGTERGFLMLDALTQGAGAAMLIIGLAVPKKVLVRNLAFELTVRPTVVARGAQGVELAGTF